jgi:cytochrome oxidase assembly protein ShyY1
MARIRFDFEWRLTLFVVVLLPFLVGLGFWQLGRADEKRILSANAIAQDAAEALSVNELDKLEPDQLLGRKVRMHGHYLAQQFLLDNQIKRSRFGNDVVQLFQDMSGRIYFVNRGWVPADPARQAATAIPATPPVKFIEGRIYIPPSQPYLLEADTLEAGRSPLTVQALDIAALSGLVTAGDQAPYPYLVRLLAEDPSAFDASWPVVNISDAKHMGYAIQWFSMAFVLSLLFIHRSSNLWAVLRGNTED